MGNTINNVGDRGVSPLNIAPTTRPSPGEQLTPVRSRSNAVAFASLQEARASLAEAHRSLTPERMKLLSNGSTPPPNTSPVSDTATKVEQLCRNSPKLGLRQCALASHRLPAPWAGGLDDDIVDDIDRREYRIETDPDEVVERLHREMQAAARQQRRLDAENTPESSLFATKSQPWLDEPADTDTSGTANSVASDGAASDGAEASIHYETPTALPNTGIAHAQGKRDAMEDAHLATKFSFLAGDQPHDVQLTALFDGHGGKGMATHASTHLVEALRLRLKEFSKDGLTDIAVWNALKVALVDVSRSYTADDAGATANVVLMIDDSLWVANVGDSRALLVSPDGHAFQLTEDAKPSDPKYQRTIVNRRGIVRQPPWRGDLRIQGPNGHWLSPGRALGDHSFEGALSARPKITKFTRPPTGWTGYALVQFCDGIPEGGATTKLAGALVHARLTKGDASAAIAAALVSIAYASGSEDNLSALVTRLA